MRIQHVTIDFAARHLIYIRRIFDMVHPHGTSWLQAGQRKKQRRVNTARDDITAFDSHVVMEMASCFCLPKGLVANQGSTIMA